MDIGLIVGAAGLVVGAVGAVIGYRAWKDQTNDQRYALTWTEPLTLPFSGWGWPRVPDAQISLGGQALGDPYTIMMSLHNTGTEPLRAEEFEHGILIHMEETSLIRAGAIGPRDRLTVRLPNATTVAVTPRLLNAGETIHVLAIVDGKPTKIAADVRATGVAKLSERKRSGDILANAERLSKLAPKVLSEASNRAPG